MKDLIKDEMSNITTLNEEFLKFLKDEQRYGDIEIPDKYIELVERNAKIYRLIETISELPSSYSKYTSCKLVKSDNSDEAKLLFTGLMNQVKGIDNFGQVLLKHMANKLDLIEKDGDE